MYSRLSQVIRIIVIVLGFVTVLYAAEAQSDCADLVQTTFVALDDACGGGDGNTACYGSATSAIPVDGDVIFNEGGDLVTLSTVRMITTQPFDQEAAIWGVATLNVHANVPRALSDQGLRYILLGDVEIENAVPIDAAFTPVDPVKLVSMVGANIRSSPSTDGRIVGSASVGSELLADGLNNDGTWLRVINENSTAWISRQIVTVIEGDIEALPVIDSSTQTLMQTFYLRTGSENPSCAEVPPSMLLVQAPDGMISTVTANGVDIRISSTIALRVLADNSMQLITISGGAISSGLTIPAGFTATIPLNTEGTSPAGPWTGLRPITNDERAFLTVLEGLPPELLYYTPTIPTPAEISAFLVSVQNASAGASTGQAAGLADCSLFGPTSPLDTLAADETSFYWDGAPGATTYRLSIYDGLGGQVYSLEIASMSTTVSAYTSAADIGDGSDFTWGVTALVEGQSACTSARVNVVRAGTSQPVANTNTTNNPPPPPPPSASPTPCPWTEC